VKVKSPQTLSPPNSPPATRPYREIDPERRRFTRSREPDPPIHGNLYTLLEDLQSNAITFNVNGQVHIVTATTPCIGRSFTSMLRVTPVIDANANALLFEACRIIFYLSHNLLLATRTRHSGNG